MQFDFYLFVGMFGELFEGEQWLIYVWRGYFQGVFVVDWVFDVENIVDLLIDGFIVIDEDVFGVVDIDV